MENTSRPIGVFDSGLGGLTVVRNILELMPNESIIYFGDTAHLPYGSKSRDQIIRFVMNDVRFLNGFDLKAIVIACNTADSIAKSIVEHSISLPVFGVVEPAARQAVNVSQTKRIGIWATNACIQSGAYEKAVKTCCPEAVVVSEACPLLVPLVEDGRFNIGDKITEQTVREYLEIMLRERVDTLILGCTHYPLLEPIIKMQAPQINIVSSSLASAQSLKNIFSLNSMYSREKTGFRRYFVSDLSDKFQENAAMLLGTDFNCTVEEVDPE